MYYCEGRVPLDRGELAVSRQRYFRNSRTEGAAGPSSGTKPKSTAPRKQRAPRGSRGPAEPRRD